MIILMILLLVVMVIYSSVLTWYRVRNLREMNEERRKQAKK
jgi:hypothetical protein